MDTLNSFDASDGAADETLEVNEAPAAAFSVRLQGEAATLGNYRDPASMAKPAVVTVANADTSNTANADAADGDAYVDFVGATSEYIEFKVNVAEAGYYDLDVGYALGAPNVNRPLRLDVNGQLFDRIFDLSTTGTSFAAYGERTTRVELKAGENTIRLSSNGFSGPNIDYLDVRAADQTKIVLQAEDLVAAAADAAGTINRDVTLDYLAARAQTAATSVETFRVGAEGDGYLDWGSAANTLEIPVTAEIAGKYQVSITYVNGGSAARPLVLSSGTETVGTFNFAPTTAPAGYPDDYFDVAPANRPTDGSDAGTVPDQSGWEGWKSETLTKNSVTATVSLTAGVNTLKLSGTNGPNIDKIEFVLVEADPVAPSEIAVDDLSVSENADGAVIGAVTVTDSDSDSHTFEVLEGGVLSTRFEVAEGNLRLKAGQSLDFETETSIAIRVVATDAQGGSVSRDFTVAVANDIADDDVPNTAPTSVKLTGSVDENTAGAIVGILSATDTEGNTITFTTADARFVVTGNELRLTDAATLNHETDNGTVVSVTATDDFGAHTTADLLLNVTDLNEAPILAGSVPAQTAAAGQATIIDLSGLNATDVDAGDGTTLAVRLAGGGPLPSGITLDGTSLEVDATAAVGDYELQVVANDGELDSNSVPFTLAVEAAAAPFAGFVRQAEDGVVITDLNANTVVRDADHKESNPSLPTGLRPGFTGTGYVDMGGETDKVAYQISVAEAGSYDLHIRYASSTLRPMNLAVNDGANGQIQFTSTDPDGTGPQDGFNIWAVKTVTVQLQAGANTVTLANNNALGPNIDALAITAVGGTPAFAIPGINSSALASVVEGATGTVLDVNATDLGGGTLLYALTGNGADDALFNIDAATGALSFKTAPDYEAAADQGGNNIYQAEVGVSNGQNTAVQALTVTVSDNPSDNNSAPVIATTALTADENQTAAGSIAASDADGDVLAYSLTANVATDNALFSIDSASGALSFLTAPDFEALGTDTEFTVEVAVSDGTVESVQLVNVAVADVLEGGPVAVRFDGAITSYSAQDRPQDGGTGPSVSEDQSALTLDGNLWKRVALEKEHAITGSTKLVFDLKVGTGADTPEIVAIGFDLNDNPFDGQRTIFQLGGTQSQGGFVDLRGKGTPNQDGTTRFVIDLGTHAGTSVSSLVFINDDDSLASLGSSAFSNVQLLEGDVPSQNRAPAVFGGGIGDRTVSEAGSIEIDLPFADPDGDALTYSFTVRDSSGNLVANTGSLAITDGILSGDVASLGAGTFTISVTASDGTASTSDDFFLTVEDTNDAPVAQDVALEPYFGKLGASFDGVDLNAFRGLFSDPNGDALTLSVEGLPAGLSVNEEGVIVGRPTEAGSFVVTVRATDLGGLSDSIDLQFDIDAAAVGDVVTVEAEAFTGLGSASGFFATGSTTASGEQLIMLNQGGTGSVTTNLSANGLPEGYYKVTAYVFDETDGESTFSLKVGDTPLLAGGSATVVLNNVGPGSFVNAPAPRGTAANAGNLKAIPFETVVYVEAGTVATLAGHALGGEFLRIDRLEFSRVESPNTAPANLTLTGSVAENAAGAAVGLLAATDADGDALTFTTSDARFAVVANATTGQAELKLAPGVALNHESDDGTTVTVTATDARGAATTGQLTLNVDDVNEAPTLATGAAIADQAFETGTGGQIDLAVLGAMDPDAGDTAAYVVQLADGGALPSGIALNGSVLGVGAGVAAGTYELNVFARDGELDSESVSFTVTVEEPGAEAPFEPIVIQAEGGTIALARAADTQSTQIRDPDHKEANPDLPTGLRPGFTGTGYLDFGNDAGDRVAYSATVEEAGTYEFSIRYASNTARPLDFVVNGGEPTSLPFAATDPDGSGPEEGFDHWSVQKVSVELKAGENNFSFAIPAGATTGPNLDSIEINRVTSADNSADEDGNLFLSGPDGILTGANKESINFNIAGRDPDITKVEVSFDGGVTRTVVLPDADGDFVADGSALTPGNYQATIFVTDEAGNVASTSMSIAVGGTATVQPFTIQAEDETQVTVNDSGTGNADTSLTREVNATTPDAFGNYRAGAVGEAYVDFGTNPGDAITFNVNAPAAGTYSVTFRYANGGDANRPLDLTLNNGTAASVDFVPGPVTGTGATATAWASWVEKTVELDLVAGANTIKLAVPAGAANGPNIDQVTFTYEGGDTDPVDPRDQIRFEEVVKINFEPAANQGSFALPAGYQTPAGFEADTGAAYGVRANGMTYGWVDVENGAVTSTPLAQPTGSMRYKDDVPEASDLQKTYAHFEYPGAPAANNERAWEMALANGTYQVTMSIGDTGGAYDSNNVVNVEGKSFFPGFTPENLEGQSPVGTAYNSAEDGEGFRSTLVTGIVQVTDGRLTIDSIGGYNTEIQHLEIERVPDLTPTDGRSADLDFSVFAAPMAASLDGQVPISIGADGSLPTGIDPSSSFVVGVQLQAVGNRGPNIAHVDGIKLVETVTGVEVAIDVQISGGADSLTIRPLQELKENTSYTLKVQDVLDLGSVEDPNGALRQFQDLTTTFVTGEAVEDVAREVAFSTTTLLDGFGDGAFGYTSVEFGPDGKLYVATITGEVHRWDVNPDGTIDKASLETLSLDYLDAGNGERRGIVGFVFDPDDPNTIWITDNAPIPREAKAFETPEFSGRVSKITLGAGGSFTGATAETYISGLPRSGGDHLTNSLEFRANPNAGEPNEPDHLLYLTQGSNSAAGAADSAWGNRPERLLNAAILEIDPTRDAPPGGFDVRTEPVTTPTTVNPASSFNADGTYDGFYNPFADDAVLKIYATGVRNAYDLVWHSNGNLYVPTNGTASGGKTPNDPTQPGLDTVISNSPKQYDYFFTVEEGGYYGHPNTLRDEYVLNGGNPTSGLDPNEVVGGNDGNSNTDGYQTGVKPDEGYDLDGVYNLGYNRSPNGATEYTGDAFGSNLKGAILFAQFSTGDNVRAIRVDADGKIIGDDVLRRPDGSVINNYIDPLDIIENPETGQLYLMTLNRGTGASQLVLLTPAPGGVTSDVTANEGGDLALVAFDVTDPSAAVFQVNGLDSDITSVRVSFNNGPETEVTLNAQKQFTVDIGGTGTGPVTAKIRVTDDALNQATATTAFTPGEEPSNPEYVTLVTVQAEDKTPGDGTSVTIATGPTAQIQVRDASNLETGTGPGYVNGLRPGAVGTDGNTVNTDGVPGGYADFGSTNADFITFNFSAEKAGTAILKFRYANGGTADRPLQVEVNGSIVKAQSFVPTTSSATSDGWTEWGFVEVPVSLVAGANSVTLRAISATGPNIDQLEVLVPAESEGVPNDGETVIGGTTYVLYEAENAELGGAPAIITEDRNQSGAFVDFVGPDTETLTWTVEVDQAGAYGVDILYALATTKTARPMALSVDGQAVETLPFAPNSDASESTWGPQSTTLQLAAGVHTITITAPAGVAPNIDQLRITKAPVEVFEPDHVAINGSGRIQLEAQDGSAHTVNGSVVEFFFTVAADGVYKLDTAANANAANGQGLTWFVNGVEIDDSAFPGAGEAGEQSVYTELKAGTQYTLRIVSDAPGASGIDYLDLSPAPGNANADIAVQSLDPAFLDNRLHFSYIENPNAVDPAAADRDFKDSGTVRISNTGTEPLSFTDVELNGPFVLANPGVFNGLTLAAGQSIDVTVLFDRAAYTPPTTNVDATSTTFQGSLKLVTNDAENPVSTIDLAGFWQARDEGGQEPNVNEIWKTFGFGNVIEGLSTRGGGENSALSTKDVFAKTDATEVLSPYWQIAEGFTEAKITQIAAFHGTGGATVGIHNPGTKSGGITFWNHEGTDNQRLLPNSGNDTSFSTRTFTTGNIPDTWAGNEVFGITVAGLSTDPRLNPRGDEEVPGAQQGHTVKMFQALDADGNVIPNTYLGIMDYTGINYDYNDNLFVIEGVEPVGFGQNMVVAGLDDAAADDRLVFTNIDNPANAQQVFRNEATVTITNDGFAPLTIEGITVADPAAFQIVGTVPTSIAAGASANVTVRFIGTHAGATAGADLFESTLTIRSNDFDQGEKVITLAGLAQEFSENGSEPTVAQIVEAFGYATDVAQGELAGGGAVETVGDEVLMPYLERLDPSRPVEVIQLGAFLNQGNVARLGFHGLSSSQVTNLFANDDQQGQTILPDQLVAGAGSGANVARGTINQNGPFGLYVSVDGRPTYSSWSDPEANEIDPNFGQLVGDNEGHLIRFFQALDAAGNVIEGTYIGIQDYPGAGNYDYNDHMFVIKNVQAHELTNAEDANNDGVNDALRSDADNDGRVNFFDPDNTPPPTGAEKGDFVLGVNFGGGAIAKDPVLGVALIAQSDPRVVVSGSVNPGPGVDDASNLNGANATAGSAFKTYEDGANWTADITVPNGTYVVVLHTQETYWNTAGKRQFDAFINGKQVINNLDPFAAAGGGDKPIAVETVVTVTNGKISINMDADIDNAALNAVTIYKQPTTTTPTAQQPFGGTPFLVDADGVTIDADDYDNGGRGIAYNDAAGLQGGTNGGRTGSDVEVTGGGDVGWIAAGDWTEYTINVQTAGKHDLEMLLSNGTGGGATARVDFYRPGEATPYASTGSIANPSTGSWTNFVERSVDGLTLEAGQQIARVTFTSGGQDFRSLSLAPSAPPAPVQTAFGGTAPVIGSAATLTVDATRFDTGGESVAYHDTTATDLGGALGRNEGVDIVGNNNAVGWVENGEWLEYTLNVAEAGDYLLTFNTATPEGGRSIVASFAAGATPYLTTGSIAVPDVNSYTAFADTQAVTVKLQAGQQVMRVLMNGGSMDLNTFEFEKVGPQQTAFNGTPLLVGAAGGTITAALFDKGGEGVAFHDTTTADLGGTAGRNESVDIVGNNQAIGWVESGEWVEYTINVQQAGSYDLSFLSALGSGGGRSISASFTQGGTAYETASVAVPSTGSWSTFRETGAAEVDLRAGVQTVRLTFNGGSQDLKSFELTPSPSSATTSAASPSTDESPMTSLATRLLGLANIIETGDASLTETVAVKTIQGSNGSDRLIGTKASDVIIGDDGNDWLLGGAGSDAFVFGDRDGRDRVLDFKNGTDHFDLSQVAAAESFDDISVKRSSAGVTVDYGTGSFLVVGASLHDIDESDFLFRDRDPIA